VVFTEFDLACSQAHCELPYLIGIVEFHIRIGIPALRRGATNNAPIVIFK